jgi:predicted nucleic acid-binding protein
VILLDTNVLVYALNGDAEQHANCRTVLELAAGDRIPAVLVPQILIECYAVITSPRRLARPLSSLQAQRALAAIRNAVPVEPVPSSFLDDVDLLLTEQPRGGRDIFDLALAAQMRRHGIPEICTCSGSDFQLPGIRPLSPSQALAQYA